MGRFKTNTDRWSPWMGRPINHALTSKLEMSVEDPKTDYLVGFHGMVDSIRLLSISIKARKVIKVREELELRSLKCDRLLVYGVVGTALHLQLGGGQIHAHRHQAARQRCVTASF